MIYSASSPPRDEGSPPRDSNYERHPRDSPAASAETRGELKLRFENGPEHDDGWASKRADTQTDRRSSPEADQHRKNVFAQICCRFSFHSSIVGHKRAPLPPQNEEYKQNSSSFVPPPTSFAGAYLPPPTKPKPRGVPLLPVKGVIPHGIRRDLPGTKPSTENPGVLGAPSGPRADRPAIPPGTKDASHPDFASQARLPPSGPSKKDPYLPSTRGPSSYRPAQSPPLMSSTSPQQRPIPPHSAAPNGAVALQSTPTPDATNDTIAQIQHVSISWFGAHNL